MMNSESQITSDQGESSSSKNDKQLTENLDSGDNVVSSTDNLKKTDQKEEPNNPKDESMEEGNEVTCSKGSLPFSKVLQQSNKEIFEGNNVNSSEESTLLAKQSTVSNEETSGPEEVSSTTAESSNTVASRDDNNATNLDPNSVHYEGDVAIYTDPKSGYQYQWLADKNEWELRNNVQYGFEDDTHVYTDSDGVKYFWDKDKNAWFPKLDDDFMAHYQMNYGFVNPSQQNSTKSPEKPKEDQGKQVKKPKGEKRKASDPTWFEVDENENTNVYVSNLPTDITEEEFVDLMQKCGLVMRDPQTLKFKVKLYRDPGTNYLKGDALCTYIKIESVDLALRLIDGSELRGHIIRVERARFQMKGEYDPKLKPKMKKKKDKMKLKRQQEKLFDWRPEKQIGERGKHEKVVIVKNLFDPSIFDKDVSLILEFQQDLREECSKLGEVRKVIIFDRHPEGVAQINMGAPEEADEVVTLLNGRWFMKRQLTAETWDGRTKYKIAETDSQISKRLNEWDKFLEDCEGSGKKESSGSKENHSKDGKGKEIGESKATENSVDITEEKK